jgi:hypothetical protein
MHAMITQAIAEERVKDMHATAEAARLARQARRARRARRGQVAAFRRARPVAGQPGRSSAAPAGG